jgi:hypothetical protein
MKTDKYWFINPGGMYPGRREGVTPLGPLEEVMK